MNNEQNPRRPPVMRGAMEAGCACWTPIRPATPDALPATVPAAGEPLKPPATVSPADGTPAPAAESET